MKPYGHELSKDDEQLRLDGYDIILDEAEFKSWSTDYQDLPKQNNNAD